MCRCNVLRMTTTFVAPIMGNQFVTVRSAGVWPYEAIAECAKCGESVQYIEVGTGFAFEHAHRLRHGQYVNNRPVPLHAQRP